VFHPNAMDMRTSGIEFAQPQTDKLSAY
jgi:hypothetical protein